MPSILGVRRILRPSVHRGNNYNSHAHFRAQNTHGRSHKWELEQITFAGDNSSTWSTGSPGISTASTLNISRFCTWDIFCTPSISCFDAAGTYLSVLSGFRTDSQYTLSSWAFSVTIYWPPVLQFYQYSDYELFSSIFYSVSVTTFSVPRASSDIFFGGNVFCMYWILISWSQSRMRERLIIQFVNSVKSVVYTRHITQLAKLSTGINYCIYSVGLTADVFHNFIKRNISQPRPHATYRIDYVYATSNELIAATQWHLFRINTHLPVAYTFFFILL